ncbi:MAG: nucleotidyl transferase AbiEii/AbiGii toxin family protein [Thermoanaerobaculia bacterium]|nr:nucleotidyl transferase AbiEii/AbiGii toxin family protein [Thermoanaerobaculia bacterium]
MDSDKVERILREFDRTGVEYKIFGGVALNLHGLPRFTEDLDIFVAPRADNVERLKSALRTAFGDPEIDEISAEDLLGDYPAIQYVPPEGDFHIDILTRLGEAFGFEDLEASDIKFRGLAVKVVTPRQLYEMKKGTVRLRDRADAELLNERFRLED